VKNLKILIALFVFAVAAVCQSAPAFSFQQGYEPITQRLCQGPQNAGSVYTVLGIAGGNQSYLCQQTGATSLGQGAFAWLPIQLTSSSGGGTLVIPLGYTATAPSANITISGISLTSCGTSASCASPTVQSPVGKMVTGTTAFSSSTTLAITGMPAFTAITSFSCYASDPTHAYTWTAANQSATAVTFTAGTSNSDSWQWACIGY
jgi:hypothetical protein